MAIQLPEVKAIEPQAPPSVGRIEAHVPDASRNAAGVENALEGTVGEAIKYRNAQADQMADSNATDADNSYQMWRKTKIYGDPTRNIRGLKDMEGNPADLYKSFEEEERKKLDELSSNEKWDTETQNLVNRRLSSRYTELRLQTLAESSAQQHKWDDGNTEVGLKLAKDGLPLATAQIHPESIATGDLSTLDPVKKKLATITNLEIARAVRYGGAVLDASGTDVYTDDAGVDHRVTLVGPTVKTKIAKETSDALHDSIMNLIDTSKQDPSAIDKARVMKQQFGDRIVVDKRNQIDKAFETADITHQSYDLAGKAVDKSPSQINTLLATTSPEVRTKALKVIADNARYRESIRRAQWNENYAALAQRAIQFKSQNPAATESDLENQPWYDAHARNMNPRDLKAINEVAAPPKESDPKALARVSAIMRGEDKDYPDGIKSIPVEDQPKVVQGLSQADRRVWLGQMNHAMTDKEASVQTSRLLNDLKQQAFRSRLIYPDALGGGDVQKGGEQDVALGQLQNEAVHLFKNYKFSSDDDMRTEIGKFIAAKIQKSAYTAPVGFQAHGPAFKVPPPGADVSPKVKDVNGKAIRDYKKLNNGSDPNPAQLKKFIDSDTSGKYSK